MMATASWRDIACSRCKSLAGRPCVSGRGKRATEPHAVRRRAARQYGAAAPTQAAVDRSGCVAKRHGDEAAYSWWKCRCPDAREAWRLYKKRLREGRHEPAMVDATGTTRRVQALVAFGYTWRDIAVALGLSPQRAANLGFGRYPVLHRDNAAKVAEVFERLSLTPGTSKYALVVAARYGFAPPDAWSELSIDDPAAEPYSDLGRGFLVDLVAVELALKGKPVKLTRVERHHAVHAGRDRGWAYTRIAEALRMSVSRAQELGAKPLPEGCEVAA